MRLRDGVSAVNTQLGASHVAGGIGEQECDSAHEIFRLAHLTLRDERDPLLGELWVVVEDLLGTMRSIWSVTLAEAMVFTNETYSAVSMYPGEMQLTRMPACAHSTASEEAMCLTAAFAAL